LRCDTLVLSMLGFGHQFLPLTINQKALRSSSDSLAKFTANAAPRRASADLVGVLRRAPLAGRREVDLPIPMPYAGDAGAAPSG
jgi:hypothetical protein